MCCLEAWCVTHYGVACVGLSGVGGEVALWGLIRRAVVCRPDVGVCLSAFIYLSIMVRCMGPRHFASVFECRPKGTRLSHEPSYAPIGMLCLTRGDNKVTYQAQPRALVRSNRDVVAAVPMVNHRDGSRARRRQRVLQHRQQLDLGERESERYELNEPQGRLRPVGHVSSPRATAEPPTATSGHRSGESLTGTTPTATNPVTL